MWQRKRIILGGVVAAIILVVAALYSPVRWYMQFRERLSMAEQHAPIVLRALEADGRFSEVKAEAFTAGGGCLLVSAVIPADTKDDVRRLVAATAPPVPVKYDLYELRSTTRPTSQVVR